MSEAPQSLEDAAGGKSMPEVMLCMSWALEVRFRDRR